MTKPKSPSPAGPSQTSSPEVQVAMNPRPPEASAPPPPPQPPREPIRETLREDVRAPEGERVRRHKGGFETTNRFHIPPEMIPEGRSLEWKRVEVMGKTDYRYEQGLYEQGWRPVEHTMWQFPGFFAPVGAEGPVIIDGMMLMERPIELTREAEAEDYARARAAKRAGERKLGDAPDGTLPRTKPTINTSHEPMTVPE